MNKNILSFFSLLPYDIQYKIYYIWLVDFNKQNFQFHRSTFLNCLDTFQVNNSRRIHLKEDGFWTYHYNRYIYTPINSICIKYFRENPYKLMSCFFSVEEKELYRLPFDREYTNSQNEFWFHSRCRCSSCDQIKMACSKCNIEIYIHLQQRKKRNYPSDIFKKKEFREKYKMVNWDKRLFPIF